MLIRKVSYSDRAAVLQCEHNCLISAQKKQHISSHIVEQSRRSCQVRILMLIHNVPEQFINFFYFR